MENKKSNHESFDVKYRDFRDTMLPDISSYEGEYFDKAVHVFLSKHWGWLSPASISLAMFDWYTHMGISPIKQMSIIREYQEKFGLLFFNAFHSFFSKDYTNLITCKKNDHRFKSHLWCEFPFNLYSQCFLLHEEVLNNATKDVRGVSHHHQNVVKFLSRQVLDIFAPSNFPLTNPEVLKVTLDSHGQNFYEGYKNYIDDIYRYIKKLPPAGCEQFEVGKNLAMTPGKVIYRNHLIELIQYEPTTPTVFRKPVLFIPAWIMKYYILDLSEHNSMVKYLVNQGHTVFMISWKNPDKEDRHLGIDDYINLGIMSALDIIEKIIPYTKVNAVGYCIGGTLLMATAAYMATRSDKRLDTITLFAAQVDFRDAGELQLFIDESQVTYLEDVMWEKGYLDGSQMAGAFSMLRSSELIYSRMIKDYLIGEREPMFDIMAWDHDTTRLPYRMHSEYLRKLFLNNLLVQGKFSVNGKKVSLGDITIPMFVVSTLTDHVSPWRSVYKIHLFCKNSIHFVLTNGGHNAGILSEPGHANRRFQMMKRKEGGKYITTESWLHSAPSMEGSWWPSWQQWLAEYSSEQTPPPKMGNPQKDIHVLHDAPGTYVHKK
ncbi:MAG: alpha/beta fold hydrolase [Proteobacteria bacterium]|nr:alpha/beta fold hydrolase [Pseudomonadota bacterium]